jgi:hypothetical protein
MRLRREETTKREVKIRQKAINHAAEYALGQVLNGHPRHYKGRVHAIFFIAAPRALENGGHRFRIVVTPFRLVLDRISLDPHLLQDFIKKKFCDLL